MIQGVLIHSVIMVKHPSKISVPKIVPEGCCESREAHHTGSISKPTSSWPGRIVQGPASSPNPYPLLQEGLLNLPTPSTCPQHLVSAKALACYPLGGRTEQRVHTQALESEFEPWLCPFQAM